MGLRIGWSPAEWDRAIADLPEDDRWTFIQIERSELGAAAPMSRTRLKALRRGMRTEARCLLDAWLEHRRQGRSLEVVG